MLSDAPPRLIRTVLTLARARLLPVLCAASALGVGSIGGAQACSAPPGGNPTCGSTGAASNSDSSPSSGAGNPINLLNGNKYQEETDLAALPGVLGIELKRYYNSQSSHPGLLGAGWRMSYETVLYDFGSEIEIVQADGRRLMFQRGLGHDGTLCTSPQPQDGQVRIEAAKDSRSGPVYYWRWADGRTLMFSSGSGGGFPLQSITAASGERATLSYSPTGELTTIRDPQGRRLDFIYASAAETSAQKRSRALKAIETPLGRIGYRQDALGRLTEVTQSRDARTPADTTRLYHYENRYNAGHALALTGISLRAPDPQNGQPVEQRLSTYAYNAAGQAVLSTKGRPREMAADGKPLPATGVDQIEIEYLDKALPHDSKIDRKTGEAIPAQLGRAILTNSLGEKTQVTSAVVGGHFRLIEMRGPGCSSCGPGNMRYAYNAAGLLVRSTQTDRDGKPLRSEINELDRYGRAVRIGLRDEAGGEPRPSRWMVRYAYADVANPDGSIAVAAQPSLLARPSVVSGKEHSIAISYNEFGQITRLREEGWSPHPDAPPTSIERETSFGYGAVNGRSLMTRVDEPGRDSPQGAGITHIRWDSLGSSVVRIDRPGATTSLELDEAGRVAAVTTTEDGYRSRSQAQFPVLGRNAVTPERIAETHWMLDAQGVPILPGQLHSISLLHDALGRLQRATQDGHSVGPETLDALRAEPNAGVPSASSVNDGDIDRDALARPVAWSDQAGQQLLDATWGEPGSAAQHDILELRTAHASARRLIDDFGRVSAVQNPGQGWQTAQHDSAGRLLRSIDARGAIQEAHYDTQGRLLALERYGPHATLAEQTLRWRYSGALIEASVSDADGIRRTLTTRDAQGHVVREVQVIEPPNGPHVSFTQDFSYDAQGRRIASRFTDAAGRHTDLRQALGGQGQPERITTAGSWPEWLGGGRTLIRHIDWLHLPTLQHLTLDFANHIEHASGQVDDYAAPEGLPREAEQVSGAHKLRASAAGPGNAASRFGSGPEQGTDRTQGPGSEPDAAGLPSHIETARGAQRLRWSSAGELTHTERADGSSSHYLYDARGRRVLKRSVDRAGQTQITTYAYDGTKLVVEADGQGRATYAYVHLGWRPVAQLLLQPDGWWPRLLAWLLGPESRPLHTDRAGQVLSMSNAKRETLWRLSDSTAAGPEILTAHQPLRYVGQYHDEESALDYHGARYYDARSGRFISPDREGVADAVNEVAATALLDLYAYAGGRPQDYFDPDGAARIRYYAITTGSNGSALGTTQGFTKARWAFIVDNVQAGGDRSALGQKRNEYASNQTGLLYDQGGNFLHANVTNAVWTGGSTGIPDQFTAHYGANLVSVPQFTVQMDDDDATSLIASYIDADRQQVFGNGCPARATLLPDIKFATEEAPINVTSAASGDADKQRILACGSGSNTDIDKRRVATYEAAAEINETAQINRNCSSNGCPGIAYYCDSARCYSPRDQLTYGPPNTTSTVYTPSYGRSQFTALTLVGQLLQAHANGDLSTSNESALGLTTATYTMLRTAQARGMKMLQWWEATGAAATFADANRAWSQLTPADQARFTRETGMGQETYTDLIRIKTSPPTNSQGTDLLRDAEQAFTTSAIMSDPAAKTFLMGIFENFDKFTVVTTAFMTSNLSRAKAAYPAASESDLAGMVARQHNGGLWRHPLAYLTQHDEHDYVKNFIGTAGFKRKGDWSSLRCTQDFGTGTVRTGSEGRGIGGLQMTPLTLS